MKIRITLHFYATLVLFFGLYVFHSFAEFSAKDLQIGIPIALGFLVLSLIEVQEDANFFGSAVLFIHTILLFSCMILMFVACLAYPEECDISQWNFIILVLFALAMCLASSQKLAVIFRGRLME